MPKTTHNLPLRVTLALALALAGALLMILANGGTPARMLDGLGLALVVAGIVSGLRALILLRYEVEAVSERLSATVHARLLEIPGNGEGIRQVTAERHGYEGYYTWTTVTAPQDLFFAGRAVLNRIDDDTRQRGFESAERVLARRLSEGASVRILFLDPRSDIVERLATEEGQPEGQMLSDIARSVGVCGRLHDLLAYDFTPRGPLSIHVYDQVPYFAYHREDEMVVVGFYFAAAVGQATAAFEIRDEGAKRLFADHFEAVSARAQPLLEYVPDQDSLRYNRDLYKSVRAALDGRPGESKTPGLVGWEL